MRGGNGRQPCAHAERAAWGYFRSGAWAIHRPYRRREVSHATLLPCPGAPAHCRATPVHVPPIAVDATPGRAGQAMSRRCCHPSKRPSPGLERGGAGRRLPLGRGASLVERIPEDAAGERPGMVPIFEQYLAIHDGVVDPLASSRTRQPPAGKSCTVSSGSGLTVSGSKIVIWAASPGRSSPRS